jgi:hypothetical protein
MKHLLITLIGTIAIATTSCEKDKTICEYEIHELKPAPMLLKNFDSSDIDSIYIVSYKTSDSSNFQARKYEFIILATDSGYVNDAIFIHNSDTIKYVDNKILIAEDGITKIITIPKISNSYTISSAADTTKRIIYETDEGGCLDRSFVEHVSIHKNEYGNAIPMYNDSRCIHLEIVK